MSAENIRKMQGIVIGAHRAKKVANEIGPYTRMDALGLGSLNVIDVFLGLKEAFDIAFEDEEIEPETVETTASLAAFVRSRAKAA